LATTSNDELCQEEDKVTLPFVDEVYKWVHYDFALVADEAPHVMNHLGQNWDTLSVGNGSKSPVQFQVSVGTELEPWQQVLPINKLNCTEPVVSWPVLHYGKLRTFASIKYLSRDHITK
jgi:hypothetical protein